MWGSKRVGGEPDRCFSVNLQPHIHEGLMRTKLTELRERLLMAQRELILSAAISGTLPSDNALRKIADLEVTIGAVEAMLEEPE